MKRILCLLLAVGMVAVFSGCSKDESGDVVSEDLLSSSVSEEPSELEPEPEPVYEAKIVNVDQGSFANIRETPDMNGKIIGRALPEEVFTPQEEGTTDIWQAIEFNGTTGYVHKDYITVIQKAAE